MKPDHTCVLLRLDVPTIIVEQNDLLVPDRSPVPPLDHPLDFLDVGTFARRDDIVRTSFLPCEEVPTIRIRTDDQEFLCDLLCSTEGFLMRSSFVTPEMMIECLSEESRDEGISGQSLAVRTHQEYIPERHDPEPETLSQEPWHEMDEATIHERHEFLDRMIPASAGVDGEDREIQIEQDCLHPTPGWKREALPTEVFLLTVCDRCPEPTIMGRLTLAPVQGLSPASDSLQVLDPGSVRLCPTRLRSLSCCGAAVVGRWLRDLIQGELIDDGGSGGGIRLLLGIRLLG